MELRHIISETIRRGTTPPINDWFKNMSNPAESVNLYKNADGMNCKVINSITDEIFSLQLANYGPLTTPTYVKFTGIAMWNNQLSYLEAYHGTDAITLQEVKELTVTPI